MPTCELFFIHPALAPTRRPRLLVVDAPQLDRLPFACAGRTDLRLARAGEITPGLIERMRPRAIAFALFSIDPDAFQMCERLMLLGWRGRVAALTGPLPDRAMVERELRAAFPALRPRVITVKALRPPR